ncbi:MAG: hypothetical protein NPIRA05_13080 [Nitrospirales bacterium]|nr:MAG: hypothetical protein NPIRA05_13080 [Nitrospirales bacterium]
MATRPSPQVPPYRITLFYGPDYLEGSPNTIQCVFNVKKRSWKGGVQIVVDVDHVQFARVGASLRFDQWLETILVQLPEDFRSESEARAKDLFAQHVCLMKLQQAIQQGIKQENATLERDMLVEELDRVTAQQADQIKNQVLTELDVEEIVAQEFS